MIVSSFSASNQFTCNNTNPCSNQLISCTESSTPCDIQCTSESSCKNTTIQCNNNQDCSILCSATNSCESIQINCPKETGNCIINGTASYSLLNMKLICSSNNINQQCDIHCDASDTTNICTNAIMDARNSSGPLYINCTGNNVCPQMTVYCPRKTEDNQKLCTISGYTTVGSGADTVHTGLQLYAYNSWEDIELSSYLAWVYNGSYMHCGDSYQYECQIGNTARRLTWNCIDNTTQCYVQNDSISEIRCDNDYQCNNTIIQCPDGKPCKIYCTGKNSCSQSIINCPSDGNKCDIICTGYRAEGACDGIKENNGTIFNCASGPNAECNILCGVPENSYGDYGFNACRYGKVKCGIDGGHCSLNVFGDQGFEYGQIDCNQANECAIKCGNAAACEESVINATDSESLDLQCITNAFDTEYEPCNDFKLYCPEMDENLEKRCFVSNPGVTNAAAGDAHHEMEIFARNSWLDINIENYSAEIYGNLNLMHCGDDENGLFNNSCVISQGDLITNSCVCDYGQFSTPSPNTGDDIDWILIIGVSIGCFFFVICALFCVLWMKRDSDMIQYEIWREKQKLKEANGNNKNANYEEVQNSDEEDDEKQMELPKTDTKQ